MTQLMLVHSRAKEGREAEYAAWYTSTHIGEVTQVSGFRSGRFHGCTGPDGRPTGEYAAVYEVADDAPPALMQRLIAASATMNMSDAMDGASVKFTFLTPA